MDVYLNRMIKSNAMIGSIPAMMSALERTAVSVTIDGRTERGPMTKIGLVNALYLGHATRNGATDATTKWACISFQIVTVERYLEDARDSFATIHNRANYGFDVIWNN